MNKKIEKYFKDKMKELDENPVIFSKTKYGQHLRDTLVKLSEPYNIHMITKSHYVTYRSCPRCFYYSQNDKDKQRPLNFDEQDRINQGLEVGQLATTYFNNTISIKKNSAKADVKLQAELTAKFLKDNANCIAEASFIYQDLFCAVDLLVKDKDGYNIYEVKATKHAKDNLEEYCADVAFQKYVLEKCGLKIKECYILYLNENYIKQGPIDVKGLFTTLDLNEQAQFGRECSQIETYLNQMRQLLSSKQLPNYGTCNKACPFFAFCHEDLAKPNILELNNIRLATAHKFINQGVITLSDYKKQAKKVSSFQAIQLSTSDQPHIDKPQIKAFLQSLKYPLYHLDFETTMKAIPCCDGHKPWQTIAFQYSLHIDTKPGSECQHREFLADQYDNEYELAKQLIKDIPAHATVVAFHVSTEEGIIKKLANRFPDLKDQLLALTTNMVDLIDPFKQGYYYNPKQHGVNSIKAIMPAMCPQLEKAYKDLPTVHNGGEALTEFPKMLEKTGKARQDSRKGMLAYCKQDTKSMVDVLNALWNLVK